MWLDRGVSYGDNNIVIYKCIISTCLHLKLTHVLSIMSQLGGKKRKEEKGPSNL